MEFQNTDDFIILEKGTVKNIIGNIKFKVADSDELRFMPILTIASSSIGNGGGSNKSSIYAIRDIEHQSLSHGSSTNVTVIITNNLTQSISLQETAPYSWNITRISDNADVFKNSTHEWVWYNVSAGATKTVIYKLEMPINASIGTYYINGTLSNSSGIVAVVSGENKIIPDILSYYRGLGNNSRVVETTDLLKAADDWSRDIKPPGYPEPILTRQLLALADEWAKS